MSTEKKDVPHVDLRVTCPVKQKIADVGVDLNIFRDQGILTGCTHLDKGETCGQACLVTQEAHEVLVHIMSTEKSKHRKDLGEVGEVIA